jgi:tetratricopeptide (TPR) repeat protein
MPADAPPDAAAAPDARRPAGPPEALLGRMREVVQALRRGDGATAARVAEPLLAEAPDNLDVLRLAGAACNAGGRYPQAREALERAHARLPGDALLLVDLGNARLHCGDPEGARAAWRRAAELLPEHPMPWYNLGRSLQVEGRTDEAIDALSRAVEHAPALMPARILLGDALVHAGRLDEADLHYREALWRNPACGDAWRGLANMKTRPLSDEDREQLALNQGRADVGEPDRVAMGYALGKACEDHGRHAEALAALQDANARLRRQARWDAAAFSVHVDEVIAATVRLPAPRDPSLGAEAIFIAGMPRSGSTLFEQVLAAHPQVEGASELPELGLVIEAESQRRGLPFPRWVPEADAGDWERLGRDYLQRTARWRERRPRFTDKMPENWLHAGVLRAMLPGAVVLETRRDPLETAWSCFRQHFYRLPHFSCDYDDIAAFMRDGARAMDAWRARDPAHVRLLSYEALVRDPGTGIRGLLEACGLPFDPACLDFHRSARSVRTASAAQVREPMRADTARTAAYGALLDPLREAIARAGLA